MRIAIGLSYFGNAFHGFQAQPDLKTVQGCLEDAISRVANHPVRIHVAGRTDTGVHATGQVIHFDTTQFRRDRAWLFGSNSYLPKDVSVQWVKPVSDAFHARFSATARTYRYVIYNHPIRSALYYATATWERGPLNEIAMQRAAQYLVGTHDFTSYRALECQARSPIRTVTDFHVVRQGRWITLEITANAFLHHMVRNIAGVLMAIGRGDRASSWAGEVLAAQDRTLGGVTAPPYGLYLTRVHYPEIFELPIAEQEVFFLEDCST